MRDFLTTERRRDIFWLLLACIGLWGWTYGRWDLWGPDESRYVQIAREALAHGHWVQLTENGQPYSEKPPLPFWMLAGALKLSGGAVTSWTVRLPSVFFGVLVVLLTYDLGRRRLSRRAGWIAAWVMLSAALLLDVTPSALLDGPMAGFIMLAMWAMLARAPGEPLSLARAALHWLGLAGAFFIKGPLALLIVWGVVAVEAARSKSWKPLRELYPFVFLPALLLLIIGWQGYLHAVEPAGFVQGQLHSALWQRIISPKLHWEWPWFYLQKLLSDNFAPWGYFFIASLVALWRGRGGRKPLGADWPALRPLLTWALAPFVFLSIIPGKREEYMLPMLPAMALVVGWYVDRRLWDGAVNIWVRRALMAIATLAGLAAFALAALIFMRHPLLAQIGFTANPSYAFVLVAVAAAATRLARRAILSESWQHIVGACVAAIMVGALGFYGAVWPGLNAQRSPRALSMAIDARLAKSKSPAATKEGEPLVGAMGKAAKSEYQVYGHYMLADMPTRPQALATSLSQTRVSVIIGEAGNFRDAAPVLDPLGFKQIFQVPDPTDPIEARAR